MINAAPNPIQQERTIFTGIQNFFERDVKFPADLAADPLAPHEVLTIEQRQEADDYFEEILQWAFGGVLESTHSMQSPSAA